MRKKFVFVPAPLEAKIFQDAPFKALHEDFDKQRKLNRQTFWLTALLLAAMVAGGGYAVYHWIATLPY